MRVIYLCPFTGRCGGVRVIASHVNGLAARGHSAEWWGLQPAPSWVQVPYRRFPSTDALGAAMQSEPDACFTGTFWTTASWIPPNVRGSSRGYYLVQDLDQWVYSGDDSGSSYKLGLRHITESEFVTEQLRTRYGQSAVNVGIGIDHDTFRPLAIPRDYNRIFTPYRPGGGPNDLKGWGTAIAVARAVRTVNAEASLVTFGQDGTPRVDPDIPHIHVGAPTDEKLRELYSQAGVFLMSSRREGFGLTAVEAMACGTPVVCTNAGGNMEFCRHGETALVGASVDELAAHIIQVQRDRAFAKAMAERGREYVVHRYQWDHVIDRLEQLNLS